MNTVKITAFPRLHISLIEMSRMGYRLNGGAGVSISNPKITMLFSVSDHFEIIDKRNKSINNDEKDRWCSILNECLEGNEFENRITCTINSNTLPHVGFGTGTIVYLASIEALYILNNSIPTREDIIKYSKRGGTSGVGIRTYFDGGIVFDVGAPNREQDIKPSGAMSFVVYPPLSIYKDKLPEWNIGVCIPDIRSKTEKEELLFFQKITDSISNDAPQILYELVNGVIAALKEQDYRTYCSAINKIQKTSWKAAERTQYGNILVEYENYLYNLGADCVGMSSFGPLLYFHAENIQEVVARMNNRLEKECCFCTSFNNKGRIIEYV